MVKKKVPKYLEVAAKLKQGVSPAELRKQGVASKTLTKAKEILNDPNSADKIAELIKTQAVIYRQPTAVDAVKTADLVGDTMQVSPDAEFIAGIRSDNPIAAAAWALSWYRHTILSWEAIRGQVQAQAARDIIEAYGEIEEKIMRRMGGPEGGPPPAEGEDETKKLLREIRGRMLNMMIGIMNVMMTTMTPGRKIEAKKISDEEWEKLKQERGMK